MGEGGKEGMGLPAWVYTKCSGKGYVGKLYNQVSFFFFNYLPALDFSLLHVRSSFLTRD